jgi:tetratricopeptide (TPR) repeat protein
LERLEERGETDEAHDRHATYFMELAERAEPALAEPDQAEWLDRLHAEWSNLRSALTWATTHDRGVIALRLGGALGRFWPMRGFLSEGIGLLQRALDGTPDAPEVVRVRALNIAGALALLRGDIQQATRWHEEALALARAAGDLPATAYALHEVAKLASELDATPDRARALWEESLAISRRLGDSFGVARCLSNLAEIRRARGDFDRAIELMEESLATWRKRGDRVYLGVTLTNLGAATRARGELDRSSSVYRESLSVIHEIGDIEGIVYSLNGLAGLALDRGQLMPAARLLGAASALAEAISLVIFERIDREQVERDTAEVRRLLGETAFADAWNAGRALPPEAAVAEALALGNEPTQPAPVTEPAPNPAERRVSRT